MKKTIKLVLAIVVVFLLVRLCTSNLGSVITLPGGLGESSSTTTGSNESGGGWFSPKSNKTATDDDTPKDISDLERELGIGTDEKPSSTINLPSTTPSTTASSAPLTFKGIPITGSSTSFGTKLVNAGFRNNGNGTYTGDFAGYSGCKVTPSGNNPVQEVRVDFPVISEWNSLEKAYDALQASLTQKYGIEPKTSTNNNIATYSLPNGTITLDADVSNQSNWHVILKYANAASTVNNSTVKNPIDDL
ncbi:MAG: hypothetical protein II406_01105 [Bacteroidales bacterium]|nr:hypothetical protein [Bacteroidales bacterium]